MSKSESGDIMQRDRMPVSAIVTTWNVESKIRDCIESVKWADEVLVVDSYSTDNTVSICEDLGCRVVQHPYKSYSEQNTWAIQQAKHDWVLIWDSDEVCTPDLRDEILKELENLQHAGYAIRRSSFFLGRWIKYSGWQKDKPTRLFDRKKGRFIIRQVHPRVDLDGSLGEFKNPMMHYPYDNLDSWVERFHRYALWSAYNAHERGDKPTIINLTFRPLFRFFRSYVLKRGFLDGKQGFIIAMFSMFSVFMRYLYLGEILDGTRGADKKENDK